MMVTQASPFRKGQDQSVNDYFSNLIREVQRLRAPSLQLTSLDQGELNSASGSIDDLFGQLRSKVSLALTGEDEKSAKKESAKSKLHRHIGHLDHDCQCQMIEAVAKPEEKKRLVELQKSRNEINRYDFFRELSDKVLNVITSEPARGILSNIEVVGSLAKIADILSELPEFQEFAKTLESIKFLASQLLSRLQKVGKRRSGEEAPHAAPVEELSFPSRTKEFAPQIHSRRADERYNPNIAETAPVEVVVVEFERFSLERQVEGLVELEMRLASELAELERAMISVIRPDIIRPKIQAVEYEISETHERREEAEDRLRYWVGPRPTLIHKFQSN